MKQPKQIDFNGVIDRNLIRLVIYLLPAVTSTAVNNLGAQVKFSISGPYTPWMRRSLTILDTESSPLLITCSEKL